jgi:N-acetylglucosaminyldiphosphoundecaprenol N-acetyl-beta-D-mannosaminyltransferase
VKPGLPEPIDVMGIPVHPVGYQDLRRALSDWIDRRGHALVLNVNVHCMNLAWSRSWLRRLLREAELVFCDGAGVMLAARLLGGRIPTRITYADWMYDLAALCAERGYSLYFLGGRPGVAERAAARLAEAAPGVDIVGMRDGYFDKTPGSAENEGVVAGINEVSPDVLVVGFGMPLQERWLAENWARLDARIALAGGAVFDYLAGDLRRAPEWMNRGGLEWLGRLAIEPRRLWRRYLIGNPLFLARVVLVRAGLLGPPSGDEPGAA